MGVNWLRDMELFVAVGHTRNFRRAAVALGIPSSTLSRRVTALEKSLGLRLLTRSTRRVELTEDGAIYLSRAGRIVEEARLAHEDLRDSKTTPRGRLRISLPLALADAIAMRWFAEFARLYPEITFEIDTAPTHIDLIADQFDAAVLVGALPDSQLNARRVSTFTFSLFAAPSYLAKRGTPSHPRDLAHHDCVRLSNLGGVWILNNGHEQLTINVTGRFTCDNDMLAMPLGIEGMSIVRLLAPLGMREVQAGRLVRILPEWHPVDTFLSVVTPSRLMPAKTRLFVDFLAVKLRDVLGGIVQPPERQG
jgi:DNA-binding transcriptional LysR family regulator